MQQNHILIFIGRSGAGKGTQIKLITDKLKSATNKNVVYVESGAHFREFVNSDSCSAEKSKQIVKDGGLQPSFLAIWIWADVLIKNVKCDEHIIFDGTPRRMSEAKILESALKFYGHEKPKVFFIDVGKDWAKEKLFGRGREDDSKESISARMDWYEKDVAETVEYIKNNPYYEFHQINGERTIEEIHKDICGRLSLS